MKILDRTIALNFNSLLLRSYADEADADLVDDTDVVEDEEVDEGFFAGLLTDEEVEEEDDVSSELLTVDEDDEVQEPVVAEEAPVVTEDAVVEPVVEAIEPVVEQPEGSSETVEAETPNFEEEVTKYKGELEKQYAISDEDAEQILTDPQLVLPKLMANMHLAMLQQVGKMMQDNMPSIVENTVKQSTTRDKRMAQLQERYPDLVTKENEAIATTALKTISQLHPGITFEAMLDKLGPIAQALMGKEAQAPAKGSTVVPIAKPKPHIPTRGTSTATARVKPKGDSMASFIDQII